MIKECLYRLIQDMDKAADEEKNEDLKIYYQGMSHGLKIAMELRMMEDECNGQQNNGCIAR